jgi:hypothetical protein
MSRITTYAFSEREVYPPSMPLVFTVLTVPDVDNGAFAAARMCLCALGAHDPDRGAVMIHH